MSDFQLVAGFEETWRPPVRPRRRTPETVLSPKAAGEAARARLVSIINRVPEVMVKVTGRTRDPGHLRAHLDYISRNGELEIEDRDGALISGRMAVKELAEDWSAIALADQRRRANTPFSHSVMLSMPTGTDPVAVRDAARAFASAIFSDRFDYVFALHTDAPHPHVHLSIRSLADNGERLNPKKADLESWRQAFAQSLRDRGVEAEATPRRARGITRKAECTPLRKLRERHEAGHGGLANVRREAVRQAAKAAFKGEADLSPWESQTLKAQVKVRGLYLAQAKLLKRSHDAADQVLGAKIEAFVRAMPAPDTQRLALARELRAANESLRDGRTPNGKERAL